LERRLSQYRRILKREPTLFKASLDVDALFEGKGYNDSFRMVGVYLIAPIMYSFVNWVVDNAIKNRCERLYFLARDGYLMYCVAIQICEERNIDIELKYLYCSRYALRSAWYHIDIEESLRYICLGGTHVTFETVMNRAGIKTDKIMDMARLLGYALEERRLSYPELALLREKLANCPEFINIVSDNARHKYPQAIAYLEQEGLYDLKKKALVDSGWTGSMQKVIGDLTRADNLTGFYFGLYEYPLEVERNTYNTYYFAPKGNIFRKAYFANSLFECILSSKQGMCVGYTDYNAVSYPILEQENNPNYDRIVDIYEIIMTFAKRVENNKISYPKSAKIFSKMFRLFMGYPTGKEAEFFGGYIFCDDLIGERDQTVAAPLTLNDIKDNRLLKRAINLKKLYKIKESAWLQGSVVRKIENPRRELFHVTLYRIVLFMRKAVKNK